MDFRELSEKELSKLSKKQLESYTTALLLNAGYKKEEVTLAKAKKNIISRDPLYFDKLNSRKDDNASIPSAELMDEKIANLNGRLKRCDARYKRIERELGKDAARRDEE